LPSSASEKLRVQVLTSNTHRTHLFPLILKVGCLPSEVRSHLLDLPRDGPVNVKIPRPLKPSQPPLLCSTSAKWPHDSVPRNAAACPSNSKFMESKHRMSPLHRQMSRTLSAPRDVRREHLLLARRVFTLRSLHLSSHTLSYSY
jgi:hypothetical protein